jgi:hypothetical protein
MDATSKRAVAIILSASIAALTFVAVPVASAARSRSYVYRLEVEGIEGNPNSQRVPAVCTSSSAVIPDTLLHWFSPNTISMWEATHWKTFNVTLNASTRISARGPYASRVRGVADVCLMNEITLSGTEAGEVNPGVFTWRLTRPARSIAAILSHPATEAVMDTEGA